MKEMAKAIDDIRREWGQRLLILGHHYQRSSVIRHADERGDSLELARKAASHPDAERIVFCGVHFMAESADILTGPGQTVYMPESGAGCPMANMATAEQMEQAWQELGGEDNGWLPVVYVNSTAAIKARCGQWGGSTCTSSNAAAVFEWAFKQDKRILFLPDEHLGVNTAHDLGLNDDEIAVYDPRGPGTTDFSKARVVVWKGFCLVHTAFTVERIREARAVLPDARIIVHPETPSEALRLADAHGSTAQIIRYVEDAPDGSTILVGTEFNLVERLAAEQAGRVTVKALSPSVCANMSKTNELNLLALLRDWPDSCRIDVDSRIAVAARKALERMLQL